MTELERDRRCKTIVHLPSVMLTGTPEQQSQTQIKLCILYMYMYMSHSWVIFLLTLLPPQRDIKDGACTCMRRSRVNSSFNSSTTTKGHKIWYTLSTQGRATNDKH